MTKKCDDYGDRKGCGQDVKVLKFEKDGQTKYETVEPHKVATFDRDGNLEMRFVPHWIVCVEQRGRYLEWQEKKADETARFLAEKGNGGGNGGGYKKSSGGHSNGGGRGYQGRSNGGGSFRKPEGRSNREPGQD